MSKIVFDDGCSFEKTEIVYRDARKIESSYSTNANETENDDGPVWKKNFDFIYTIVRK